MSVRRPLWVQRLAFLIFELTDPAGAARLRMSRGALNEAGSGPAGRSLGLDDPASLSALSGEEPRRELTLASGPTDRGPSSPLSASANVVSLPGTSSPLLEARPRTSVPGLGGRAQLLLFALIVLGTPLGWAIGTLAGASL